MDAHRSLRARRASGGVTARQTSCGPLSVQEPDEEEPPAEEPPTEEPPAEEPPGDGRQVGPLLVLLAIIALLLGGLAG